MPNLSSKQVARQRKRTKSGKYSEMNKCEVCDKGLGDYDYFSLPEPGGKREKELGVFGLVLCGPCCSELEKKYDVPEFAEGDQVLYIPNHSSGDRSDPANERGVVSKVEGSGIDAKVWVRYSTGSTGALTSLKNLVKA